MKKPPIIIGTGFITLDIVMDHHSDRNAQTFAGGTCGNVLAALSFLGWQAIPLARLSKDNAAKRVMKDLGKWNVKLDFINLEPSVRTPIVIQETKTDSRGESYPKYSLTCPKCGSWFPSYRAVLSNTIKEIVGSLPAPKVFFFDRVSRGVIDLAKKFSSKDAIIYFEPSGVGDEKQFREALDTSHIVKYARDRAKLIRPLVELASPLVEIETLGKSGLRYRSSLPPYPNREWKNIAPFPARAVDTAGAGDWCTAGIIHSIGAAGLKGLSNMSSNDLDNALQIGQAMAAWSCGFQGARGGMYSSTLTQMKTFVRSRLKNTDEISKVASRGTTRSRSLKFECPACDA